MRVQKLTNVSGQTVCVQHDGLETRLPPGKVLENIQMSSGEISRLGETIVATYDLGEIRESNTKTKLFD